SENHGFRRAGDDGAFQESAVEREESRMFARVSDDGAFQESAVEREESRMFAEKRTNPYYPTCNVPCAWQLRWTVIWPGPALTCWTGLYSKTSAAEAPLSSNRSRAWTGRAARHGSMRHCGRSRILNSNAQFAPHSCRAWPQRSEWAHWRSVGAQ